MEGNCEQSPTSSTDSWMYVKSNDGFGNDPVEK